MKFAKVLEQTLVEEDLPDSWVEAAIQYKLLKKCIARVVKELEFVGLSKAELKVMMQNEDEVLEFPNDDSLPSHSVVAKYLFARQTGSIVPYLKITVNDKEGLDEMANEIRERIESVLEDDHIVEITEEADQLVLSPTTSKDQLVTVKDNEIIVMLKLDLRFFRMLDSELASLQKLREDEEKQLIQSVEKVGDQVMLLTLKRDDLYRWREVFRLYLELEVFFRYNDAEHKQMERLAEQVKGNLQEFMERVNKTGALQRSKRSKETYAQFVQINQRLLKSLQFQSINSTALRKILKKFDKQTALNVLGRFGDMLSQQRIFLGTASIAQTICCIMQSRLLPIVPQLDDYTCPICVSVAYKPIKLVCGHLFCVRCLVKMKQRKKVDCPLCRHPEAVALADLSNLDVEAMALIKKSFPLEVKEKLKESEKERYKEVVGDKSCVIV